MDHLDEDKILEVKNLSFSYLDSTRIFNGANLSLGKSDRLGLWGPNGSGKTTFFRLLTGLDKAQEGEIYFNGKLCTSKADFEKLRLKVGFVLQHPDDQLFFPEVIEDVAFGPLNQGLSQQEAKDKSLSILDKLDIAHLAHSLSFKLSGGQKKLVTLASVLSMDPKLLLLDEPTNGLDSKSRMRLIDIINEIKVPMIIVSHDPDLLKATANRYETISDGKFIPIEAPIEHVHSHTHFFGQLHHTHE